MPPVLYFSESADEGSACQGTGSASPLASLRNPSLFEIFSNPLPLRMLISTSLIMNDCFDLLELLLLFASGNVIAAAVVPSGGDERCCC